MSRAVLLLLLIQSIAIAGLVDAAPPNIVWIIADDMSPDIAAYGTQGVKTPNLDRLVKEGKRFTHAFATAPVCSSSRSAFILGCYQTSTGLHAHDVENPQPLEAPYRPLPQILREAGWYVTNAMASGTEETGLALTKGKTHYNFAHDAATMFDGRDWRDRKPGQPFFAQFQIREPHRPFPIPSSFDEDLLNAISLPPNYPRHPLMLRDWYAYLRSVEVVDQRVGMILEELEKEGDLADTIVMFFADHGRPMPWGKQWLSIEGLNVPLIMRGPGIQPGSTEARVTSLVDLAPSILGIANITPPNWMEGEPILGDEWPNRSYVFAARDRCGDAQDRIRAVIGNDHLLVRNFYPELPRLNWSSYKEDHYPGMPLLRSLNGRKELDPTQEVWLGSTRPEIELYNLKNDPSGIEEVSTKPGYRSVVLEMQNALKDWMQSTDDRGALADPVTEPSLAEIQTKKRAQSRNLWKQRVDDPSPADERRLEWWNDAYGLNDSQE